MKTLSTIIVFTMLSLGQANAQNLNFEFTVANERMVSIGKAAPAEYAKPMSPKLVSFKDNILTITTISSGKVYDKLNVIRVIELKKDNNITYALEVKDKNDLFNYYLYIVNKSASGESKYLVTPFIVNGRLIMENTFFE